MGEFVESVGENDDLIILTQLVDKGTSARHRAHFGDHLLDIRQAELVLAQDVQAVGHQLVVIRFVACRALQFGNAGTFGKFDPDFRNQNTFKIKTNDLHGQLPAEC
jgi:hypothetical protein